MYEDRFLRKGFDHHELHYKDLENSKKTAELIPIKFPDKNSIKHETKVQLFENRECEFL